MIGSRLQEHTRESYITSEGVTGYYFLAHDVELRWYWASARGDHPNPLTTQFCGPWRHKGEAIIAGEDWVAATSKPMPTA